MIYFLKLKLFIVNNKGMSHALYVQCKLHGGPKEWTLSFYSYDVSNTKYNTRENRGFAGRGSVLWRQCNTLCVSGFVDDVIFSHNGANKPESKMTSMFCPVRQVAAPGAKSAVFDCIVFSCQVVFSLYISSRSSFC